MTSLVKPGHLDLPGALGLITHRAAHVLGIEAGTLAVDAPADLTLFDPNEEWNVQRNDFHSKSTNSRSSD